jgi:hypothetical protein
VSGRYAAVLYRLDPDHRRLGDDAYAFRCPFPERHRNGDRTPSGRAMVGRDGKLLCRCFGCGATVAELRAFAGGDLAEWHPPDWTPRVPPRPRGHHRRRRPVSSRIVAEYPYTDWRTGETLAVKLRWEPGFHDGRAKDFTWRRPLPDQFRKAAGVPADAFAWCGGPGVLRGGEFSRKKVGDDGTHYFRPTTGDDNHSYRLDPVAIGPYREWEARHHPGRLLFVTEGEGKADLLRSLGFVAVSSPHGKGSWEAGWGSLFHGRPVAVVPDRDGPKDTGLEWADKVCGNAVRWRASELYVVEVPRDGFAAEASVDVKDWLLRMDPAARPGAVRRLVAANKVYKRGA